MPPAGIDLGFIYIRFYGILIVLGAVAATWLASREVKRFGQNPELAWDLMPWALIGGIIGARLWHIFTPTASMVEGGLTTAYYLTHPLDMLMIWNGGLGIPGGVIGGFLAVWIYARKHDMPIGVWADACAPGLPLAQAIGRWGNFFNQEVYGAPTNLPWKIFIEPINRLAAYKSVEYYHPLFLYESLWNLLSMGVILWIGRRFADKLKTWDLFLVYLVLYPVGRFCLEFLRLDPSPVAGLNINQTIMAVVAVFAVVTLIVKHRRKSES
jgi:phosphatidylglycerol---prolipoprotein diacylglyceryl transferase